MWTLRYDPRVRKKLEKIRNKTLIRRIEESAKTLQENPLAGKPLRGYPRVRSKRIGTPEGEYRLIYLPVEDKREVFIILVGSRDEVYELLGRKKI